MWKLAVKYCGGCNPSIDRAELVGKVAVLLAERNADWKLVTLKESDYDAVLLVNGCPVGCVQKQFLNETRPVILVAGESIQREKAAEAALPEKVAELLLSMNEKTDVEGKERKRDKNTAAGCEGEKYEGFGDCRFGPQGRQFGNIGERNAGVVAGLSGEKSAPP